MNVTDNQREYAEQVFNDLRAAGVRVQKDFRNEKLGFKIREAQMQKTPYMLVIGDREMEEGKVTPRFRDGKNLDSMTCDAFIQFVTDECRDYR